MRIGIIGAGISGLSIGRLLSSKCDIEIFEYCSIPGGIAKTKLVHNVPYHLIGGHCFNSKNDAVLSYVFNSILNRSEWHSVERKARIWIDEMFINYPIEFNIKEVVTKNPSLAVEIIRDFLSAKENNSVDLENWFYGHFGKKLSEWYFIPYNTKIWGMHPRQMKANWVSGKLPIPDSISFVKALTGNVIDNMPHASFFYPNTNNQEDFIRALAKGLKISFNYKVDRLEKAGSKWIVNGEKTFDKIISTMPLRDIPRIIAGVSGKIISVAESLRCNRISTMLWKTEPQHGTWTYYPEEQITFHRSIHIGNFLSPPRSEYTITEALGVHTEDEMINAGKRLEYLVEPLGYNVSDDAYVVFDANYKDSVQIIKDYLILSGIHPLGRFGEWQYYNMDACMESAMRLAEEVLSET